MAKNDNPHARRLMDSMTKHGAGAAAQAFAAEHPLSKTANPAKKFAWAKDVCACLEENFDEETVKAIRMDCACGPAAGMIAKLRALYEKDPDPKTFAENVTALHSGFALEYDGAAYYLVYPQCYCSCVQRFPETLPAAWCYCTLGFTKRMYEGVFGTEVQAELQSSVKLGGGVCRIKITVKAEE